MHSADLGVHNCIYCPALTCLYCLIIHATALIHRHSKDEAQLAGRSRRMEPNRASAKPSETERAASRVIMTSDSNHDSAKKDV